MVSAIGVLILALVPAPKTVPQIAQVTTPTSVSEADTAKPSAPASTLSVPAIVNPSADSKTSQQAWDSVTLDKKTTSSSSAKFNEVSLGNLESEESLSTIRIPEPEPVQPVKMVMVETRQSSRAWLALSLVQHGAATFDAYSTRQAVSKGAVEDDPMMRPFANSPAIYAAIQVGPVLLDILARHMQRSENGLMRRIWWVPQTVSTAGFLISGVHNMNVAGHP